MKKIMFNDDFLLTTATIRGAKTNTRRDELTKEEQKKFAEYERVGLKPCIRHNCIILENDMGFIVFSKPTRYKVGEAVAVAMSYRDAGVRFLLEEDDEFGGHSFPAEQTKGWNNKMFVKAEYMPERIFITQSRIERLQDISDEDCIKEGVLCSDKYAMPFGIPERKAPNRVFFYYHTPREAFADLIDRVSGGGTWERNPYVVVYDYKLLK